MFVRLSLEITSFSMGHICVILEVCFQNWAVHHCWHTVTLNEMVVSAHNESFILESADTSTAGGVWLMTYGTNAWLHTHSWHVAMYLAQQLILKHVCPCSYQPVLTSWSGACCMVGCCQVLSQVSFWQRCLSHCVGFCHAVCLSRPCKLWRCV